MAALKKFLSSLKASGRSTIKETEALVSSFESGIVSLDSTIKSLPVSKSTHGFIELSENSVGRVHSIMREGNLVDILKLSEKEIPYTSKDVASYKNMLNVTPERSNRELADLTLANKKIYPQLNIVEADFDKISKTAAADIVKVEKNSFKYFKNGTKIALTIGVAVIGVNWVRKAVQQAKGCHMLTVIDNKTTSCKVAAYSCVGEDGNMCSQKLDHTNATLALMVVVAMPDTDALKIKLATATGIAVDELEDNITKIIDTKYEKIYETIHANKDEIPKFNICDIKNDKVEGGLIPPCRLCSPSDNPISTTFIDPKDYADNITFQCVDNPSILSVISDAAKTTGKDLFAGISNTLFSILKPFIIAMVAIVFIIVLISFIIKYAQNSTNKILNQNQ